MVILVDIDGPLADFEAGFLATWKKLYPGRFFISKAERQTDSLYTQYPEEFHADIHDILVTPGFWLDLPPVEGAAEVLKEWASSGHEIFFCSSPYMKYPGCAGEKIEWLMRHFLLPDLGRRTIFTKQKSMIRGDFLIDDRIQLDGSVRPIWEPVLYTLPHNKTSTVKRRMTWGTWRKALPELLSC